MGRSVNPRIPLSVLISPSMIFHQLSNVDFGKSKMCVFLQKIIGMIFCVFPKIGGKPPKWMVYNGKPYVQMDDLGIPLFLDTPI